MDKVYSMLGLATKAGKVVSGEFATDKSVKSATAMVTVNETALHGTVLHEACCEDLTCHGSNIALAAYLRSDEGHVLHCTAVDPSEETCRTLGVLNVKTIDGIVLGN